MSARPAVKSKKEPAVVSDAYVWVSVVLLAAYVAIHLPMLGRSLVDLGGILTALVFGR
jgi:hypothetical protein